MKYPVVLFDLDGTLINTNELILASFMHTLNTHCPNRYTEEDVLACMGEPLFEQMKKFDESQAEQMVQTYRTHNIAHHDAYVKEFPQVVEVLHELRRAGVRMGVVSNKTRKVVGMGLVLFQLDGLMEAIVCVDEVSKGKPDPEMILVALEKMGASPEQTLMVGDSRYDIIAGQRAHVATAAVMWSLHHHHFTEHKPDYFLHEMRDLLEIVGI